MARPGSVQNPYPTSRSVNVTNASLVVLAQNSRRRGLLIMNPSATATVSLQQQAAGVTDAAFTVGQSQGVAAVLNGLDTITLAPLGSMLMDGIPFPNALTGISSAASSPLTILEWN